jgi:catechol 2,3-dioxygenase-like lactoylglutathione lyase family enzyme
VISARLPTGLVVSDVARSLAFYCDLLGYRVGGELPLPGEQERWDDYYERISGIPGAKIRCVYLEAPDGDTHIELIEHQSPRVPAPPRRALHEPGTAILVLKVTGSAEIVARLRAANVDVVSDPVPYTSLDGTSSYTTYLYDPDGIGVCLFEGPHQLGRG